MKKVARETQLVQFLCNTVGLLAEQQETATLT